MFSRGPSHVVVGSQGFSASGSPIALSSWSGAAFPLSGGQTVTYQLVALPPGPNSNPCYVAHASGIVNFPLWLNENYYVMGVGLYVSHYDSGLGRWPLRSISRSVCSDEWLLMSMLAFEAPNENVGVVLALTNLEVSVSSSLPCFLRQGEALHLVVEFLGTDNPSATVFAGSFVRTRITSALPIVLRGDT
jgi:hypothetical protein